MIVGIIILFGSLYLFNNTILIYKEGIKMSTAD